MKIIRLATGQEVLVDDEDFDSLNQFKWQIFQNKYAIRTVMVDKKQKKIRMHRQIMNTPRNKFTDHINGNGLDNRRENLRNCSNAENMKNTKKRKTNITGFKGISKYGNKWKVLIHSDGVSYYCGIFNEKIHAAMAYDIWAKELHGEYARLNFNSI